MKAFFETCIFMLSCIFLFSDHGVHALSYNYYATTECLGEPAGGAIDGGGVIINPEFKHNIEGWQVFGHGEIEERLSKDGNRFIVANSRKRSLDSFSQKVQVEQGKIYVFSAWVQVSEGSDIVAVVFKPDKGDITHGGRVIARTGCWSFLKGGMFANFSSTVEIFFESNNISLEIWVDNVSFQPFTKQQWRSHQDESISRVRKSTVRFQATHADKRTPLKGAKVTIKQTKPNFPLGCAMNHNILTSIGYQNWFTTRFKATTFTNEMKWYSTEIKQGQENYTLADAMMGFARRNKISVRGHNVFWADQKFQPRWVKSLSPKDLRTAWAKRLDSVVSRYKGELISWDVMNENLHFRFFEERLGPNASAESYYRAQEIDPRATVFLNEFNTIEYSNDKASNPFSYHKKVLEIMSFRGKNANISAGIGVQGRFGSGQPNLAYMRSALDILAATGLPIWLTEVTVQNGPNQAHHLEEILREGYSHPAVQGIILFAGPKMAGFKIPTLADDNFKNTPSGDVVDKLIKDWASVKMETQTDAHGFLEISLFHGDYDVTVKHPKTNSSTTTSFKLTKDHKRDSTLRVHIST